MALLLPWPVPGEKRKQELSLRLESRGGPCRRLLGCCATPRSRSRNRSRKRAQSFCMWEWEAQFDCISGQLSLPPGSFPEPLRTHTPTHAHSPGSSGASDSEEHLGDEAWGLW